MAVKLFYCYAHEDKTLRASLEKHLATLKRQELIADWYDRNINAGKDWAKEVDSNLNTANIILLLISPDFMASDYCYSKELKRALERHENGTARVIPIILRHIDYDGEPFSRLEALPTDAIPVTDRKWRNRDQAFFDVAQGIRKVVKELLCEQWLDEGNIHFYRQHYNEALKAFEKAISLDPTNALVYIGKGQTLNQLGSDQSVQDDPLADLDYSIQALAAFEQAINLDPTNSHAYEGKGNALLGYSWWTKKEEILSAYEQAIRLDSNNEAAYIGLGNTFMRFSRYVEALAAFEKAIEVALFPNREAYRGKGNALHNLERYAEALTVFEQFIQEFPDSGIAYRGKGNALYNLERYAEALTAYSKAISLGCNSAHLHYALGNVLYQLKSYQKALEAFEQAIRLDSSLSDAYQGKGNVLKLLAEEAFKKAEENDHPF